MSDSPAEEIRALARARGIEIPGEIALNELGLDFRLARARDSEGRLWALRQPRHEPARKRAGKEAEFLRFLRPRLPFAVPDWRIATPELIAYPWLEDPVALLAEPLEGGEYRLTWALDRESPKFGPSLAKALAALHGIPVEEARAAGFPVLTPEEVRAKAAADLDRVGREIGIPPEKERRWREWLDADALWPPFCALIHGDLYVGHVLVTPEGELSGVIDWTEARVSDPALDFSAHAKVFGREGLEALVQAYEAAGGRVWPGLVEQALARDSASALVYGVFALDQKDPAHLEAAKAMIQQPDAEL